MFVSVGGLREERVNWRLVRDLLHTNTSDTVDFLRMVTNGVRLGYTIIKENTHDSSFIKVFFKIKIFVSSGAD